MPLPLQDEVVNHEIRLYRLYAPLSGILHPHSLIAVKLHIRPQVQLETYRIFHREAHGHCVLAKDEVIRM